jgi:heme/copper-type cytochrome/quinol oxidase subunit 3
LSRSSSARNGAKTNVSLLLSVHDVESHSDPHAEIHVEEQAHGIENRKKATWLFLGSEVMFFTFLIAGFLYAYILHSEGHSVLNIPVTNLNTFLLLTSSLTVVRSLAASKRVINSSLPAPSPPYLQCVYVAADARTPVTLFVA